MNNNAYSVLTGKTILIVDDSYINNSIVRTMFEHNGVKVLTAENGNDAVLQYEESEEFSINAILMDLSMPVMDGFEASKKIRNANRKDAKKIPIIALTANGEDSHKQKCIDAGMTDFMTKPLDPSKLMKILSSHLE